jgi:hypothetical protein
MKDTLPKVTAAALAGNTYTNLSSAQRRLWFLYQMDEHKSQFNIVLNIALNGQMVAAERLEEAFNKTIERHQVVRSRYQESVGGPQQWHQSISTSKIKLNLLDLRQHSVENQLSALEQLLAAEQAQGFDLGSGPLLRVHLLRYSQTEYEIVINIHHIACDGRSGEILLHDMAAYYNANTLPAVALQYSDYIRWESSTEVSQARERHMAFWREYLLGMPVVVQYPARQRAQSTIIAKREQFYLNDAQLKHFKGVAKKQRQPLFTALMSVFNLWFYFISDQQRFLVGTDVHGRDVVDLADVVGFFVNQLIIKCDLNKTQTFYELLSDTKKHTKSALAHRIVPFDCLVSELNCDRKQQGAPFFQVKMNYQRNRCAIEHLGGATVTKTQVLQHLADYDLVMDIMEEGQGLRINLEYNQQLFSAGEIKGFAYLWQQLCAQFESLLDLDLQSITQRMQLWHQQYQLQQQKLLLSQNRAQIIKRAAPRRVLQSHQESQ